jgi:hypothetical protein
VNDNAKNKIDMPIVTIQALPPDEPRQISQTLEKVVHELAAAVDTLPENVWANFVPFTALREGDAVYGRKDYHPIVTVLANPRSEELVSKGLNAVAGAVAAGLDIKKENVWIHWIDLPAGRVFYDNKVS